MGQRSSEGDWYEDPTILLMMSVGELKLRSRPMDAPVARRYERTVA
jgi:hypothetical protein